MSEREHERLAILLKGLVDPKNSEIKGTIRRSLELAGMDSVDIRLYEATGRLPRKYQNSADDDDFMTGFREMEEEFDKTFRESTEFETTTDVDRFAGIHKRIFSLNIKFPFIPVVVGILIGSIIFLIFSVFIFDNDSDDTVSQTELPTMEDNMSPIQDGDKL